MGGLLQKIGINLQEKVSKEVSKYDQPIKLKKMSDQEIKKMKSQFSIFFDEPKSKG